MKGGVSKLSEQNFVHPVVSEQLAYFGMLVLIRTNPMHQVHLYWSSHNLFHVKEIPAFMTQKSVHQITNNVHLNDNTQMLKKVSKEYDRCFRVHPLNKMRNEHFQKEYMPSSRVAVDESVISLKGRSSIKQYMPVKPKVRHGYKVW